MEPSPRDFFFVPAERWIDRSHHGVDVDVDLTDANSNAACTYCTVQYTTQRLATNPE